MLLLASAVGGTPSQATGSGDPFISVLDRPDSDPAPNLAWWLREMDIRPTGTSVSGVTIERLNAARSPAEARWCYANEMSAQSFASPIPAVQREIAETFAREAAALFRAAGTFTGGPMLDAVVATYAACGGGTGNFILITDRAQPEPGIVYLRSLPDWTGLIFMTRDGPRLRVHSCFECGHAEQLSYDRRRRRWRWESLGD